MDQNKLNEILRLHGMWLRGADGGIRANLNGAILTGAKLPGAILSEAKWIERIIR